MMNNIRLIQHGSNSSNASHANLLNTNPTTNTHQPQQLSHNFQLAHATSSLPLQSNNLALQQFSAPNAYAFTYNQELYNAQAGYAAANAQHLNRLHSDYELYPHENMLATQPQASTTFLQLGQPHLAHSFHSFLKQESEPPSSDESSFGGESHNAGVIRKAERVKVSKGFLPNKIAVVTPEISTLMQQSHTLNSTNHFCYVPGRLSLLSSAAKYEVTVDEIGRRINPPESLNASVLGSILRRAKSKDGGKSLRDKLKSHGLVLPAGRRKASNLNGFTALVEFEASQLAGDFEKLCEHEFPAQSMAIYMTRLHNDSNTMSPEQRRNLIHVTKQLINEFCEILSKDGSALCSNPGTQTLDPVIQKPLSHFSLVTHGFGTRAVNAGLNAFKKYLDCMDESLKLLDTK